MMVPGFLRRRRKMVVTVTVVLVVAAAVALYVWNMPSDSPAERPTGDRGRRNMFRGRWPSGPVVGRVGQDEITLGDLDSARRDMDILSMVARLGAHPMAPQHEAFNMIRRNGPNMRLAYCLLLHEAEKSGITVSRAEIDRFLISVELVDEVYTNRIAEIREKGITEKSFRNLIGRWLAVYKVYATSVDKSPPSSAEVDRLYRDVVEQINLRVLRIAAEGFLKDVPERVADEEIQDQYKRYATVLPGRVASPESFGFGYLVPNRVEVGYLLIDGESIVRAARPSREDIEDYWIRHEDEFTKEVPAAPKGAASRPARGPTTKPTSAPATRPAMKTVKKSLAEASDEIIDILRPGIVRKRLESVTNSIENVRVELAEAGDTGGLEVYREIRKRIIQSADRALRKKVTTRFVAKPLDEAIAELARDAGLVGICYPWGRQGTYSLDPKVKVSLDGSSGVTLAVALDRITAQAFAQPGPEDKNKSPAVPTLRWALCKGLGGMLFCHGGEVDMFPIKVGGTGMLDQVELSRHAVLGGATTGRRGGTPLAVLAFMAKEFGASGRSIPAEVGKDGKRMYVRGGPVIWRLLKAVPAHPPVSPGTNPARYPAGLRERVVQDVRLGKAFALAMKRAREIEVKAGTDGLEAVAKAEKLETSETGPFARKRAIPLQAGIARMIAEDLRRFRIEGVDVPGLPPFITPWNHVASVDLPRRNLIAEMPALQAFERQLPAPGYLNIVLGTFSADMHGEKFMRKAFSLMPADPEQRGPGKPPAVAVFLLPARREVYVLERIDQVPLAASDLEAARKHVSGIIQANRHWGGMMQWFAADSIVARTDFVRVEAE